MGKLESRSYSAEWCSNWPWKFLALAVWRGYTYIGQLGSHHCSERLCSDQYSCRRWSFRARICKSIW
ncbi:hypothetical protein ABKV19_023747 [Rosa sericea]